MKKAFIYGICFLGMAGFAAAEDFKTTATHAYLMDYDTGEVLFEKKGDDLMPPASMSKLMTAYIVFDKIKKGELSLDNTFTVSENAWRKGGEKSGSSTMFLKPNSKVLLSDLIKGIIIQSGNDACICVAENISGSEESFAREMTIKARELGMTQSTFKNATGWPNKEHLSTPKELALLAQRIITDFPEFYPLYSEKSFKYNKIKQENRNPLLYSMPGQADGMKTGHTEKSGYGLVGSAKSKDGRRRLILVVNGLKTMKERGTEAKRLMEWGFVEYENYQLFEPNKPIESIPVWLGKKETVPAVLPKKAIITLKRENKAKTVISISYDAPVTAPVKKGQVIASLNVTYPDTGKVLSFPLVAGEDVKKVGYFGKIKAFFMSLGK